LASCHLTIASEIETVPARAAPAYLAGKPPSCASPNEFAKPAATMTVSERGIGIETADMLVNEVLCRNLLDRRAVARYAGMTGSPDESSAGRGVPHHQGRTQGHIAKADTGNESPECSGPIAAARFMSRSPRGQIWWASVSPASTIRAERPTPRALGWVNGFAGRD
jgi:hypothetical protein